MSKSRGASQERPTCQVLCLLLRAEPIAKTTVVKRRKTRQPHPCKTRKDGPPKSLLRPRGSAARRPTTTTPHLVRGPRLRRVRNIDNRVHLVANLWIKLVDRNQKSQLVEICLSHEIRNPKSLEVVLEEWR